MDYDDHYFVLDNRLASFLGPQPISKRRPSTAASKKLASWPHRTPAPEDLARAGFFFNPQPSNPDNVRCFLCHKDLDGWEEEDDPLQEHLKHSSSCGWAICAAIELELGEVANEDPRLSYLLDARKATFANLWPYESKKGWKCKTKQLAEAGWKYTPTLESDDNTTCTYCQLALDGWESGDKPLDEHQRRSPDCPFFVLTRNPLKKQARGKAARTSKASNSRLSVQSVQSFQSAQSVATVTSDTPSLADPDESIMTTTTTQTAHKSTTASTSRARKAATGTATKGRKTRTKKDEPIVIEDSILEEPPLEPTVEDVTATPQFVEEPSVMEVAAPAPAQAKAPVKAARGKKRTSEQARSVQPSRGKKRTSEESGPADSTEAEFEAPAPKKRATRVRASNNSASAQAPATSSNDYAMFNPTAPDVDEADIEAELRALEHDMEVDQKMEDQLQNQILQEQGLEQEQEQEIQVPKKGRKAAGTRKVLKQTARKTKDPAPVEEVVQPESEQAPELETHEPEPEPPAPVPVQAKPKAKGRPRKVSQQPQPPPPPPPPDHDTEEDELHESSIISIMSTDTVVRESEKAVTGKQKAKAKANPQPTQTKTVTAVPVPAPTAVLAPPPVPKHASEPVAEAAPAPPKRGRGRPSKKSMDSMRSSIGNTSQASITSTGSIVPAKITPIPPPSVPVIAMKATEAVAPKATTKAPTEKRTAKALPPLPKTRLSLQDIEEREMREQQAKKQAHEEQARKEEALRQEALRKEEEEEALREEALMEEQLQREQLQKEQLEKERLEAEKEQRKKQAPKKQQPKKQTARQSPEEQEPHLSVAPATPHKLSPVASAKQATLSPSQSPQSSDAENQPPSSRQAAKGKTMAQVSHVPIPLFPAPPTISTAALNANMTPVRGSPSKRTTNGNTLGGLRSALPWTAVDVDTVFELNKENTGGNGDSSEQEVLESLLRKGTELTTPEKAMTVEEFILHNAGQAERLLKDECEAMVSQFEQHGSRAMRVLESLEAAE